MSFLKPVLSCVTFAFVLSASFSAVGAEAIFGPEFNFSNAAMTRDSIAAGGTIVNVPAVVEERAKFAERVRLKCPECVLTPATDKYGADRTIVAHPDGWKFYISVDPGVVEIQVDPMTAQQIDDAKSEMQRLIFETAKDQGLESRDAGGHIHIGVKRAFERNPLLFRNFVVDWFIHSAALFDLFGANEYNSPTVDRIGEGSLDNLKKIVKLFDESQIWKRVPAAPTPLSKLKNAIRTLQKKLIGRSFEDVFVHTPTGYEMKDLAVAILDYVYFQTASKFRPTEKYQNQNLTRMLKAEDEQTIELRAVREMRSAEDYLIWAKLLQGRIDFLEAKNEPIAFDGIYQPRDVRESVQDFYEYAADSGLEWTEVSSQMEPWLQRYVPKMRANACADIFSAAGAF